MSRATPSCHGPTSSTGGRSESLARRREIVCFPRRRPSGVHTGASCRSVLKIVEEELMVDGAREHQFDIWARRRCGTGAEWCPPALKKLAERLDWSSQMPSCGEEMRSSLLPSKGFECLGHPLLAQSLWWRIWKAKLGNMRFCSSGSWRSRTPKRVGCSC